MVRRMNLLAIDTALEKCSVGVAAVAHAPVLLSETIGRGHAERLFGMISEAMDSAVLSFPALDRIAVTVGPGSFTGVRVGIAAARGFGLVIGCPVVGVGTLAAIGARARMLAGDVPTLAVLDARRDEIYGQLFDAAGAALTTPAVGPVGYFAALVDDGVVLAGSGAALVAASVGGSARIVHEESAPDIAVLVGLGLAAPVSPGPPRPFYLRPPDAKPQTSAAVARR